MEVPEPSIVIFINRESFLQTMDKLTPEACIVLAGVIDGTLTRLCYTAAQPGKVMLQRDTTWKGYTTKLF